MGWPDTSLREQYDARARAADGSRSANRPRPTKPRFVRARPGSAPYPANPWAMTWPVASAPARPKRRAKIDKGRTQVSQDAGTLSENYKSSVRPGKISPNHGGNRAVWDTVGANASEPNLGTPPKVEPIGEWHFDKDGVPVAGPEPKPAAPPPKSGTAEPSTAREKDRGGETGKR